MIIEVILRLTIIISSLILMICTVIGLKASRESGGRTTSLTSAPCPF